MSERDKDAGPIKALEELLPVLPRDPGAAAHGKANFLKQASEMRAVETGKQQSRQKSIFGAIFSTPTGKRRGQAYKSLLAAVIILVFLFGGSGLTVYAAQDSLPNAGLYPLKTWSEDTVLKLVVSSPSRINYVLDFSDRRLDEMAGLVIAGQVIPEGVVLRLQDEMEQALDLAASMDDVQLIQQIERIRQRAESQLGKVDALITAAAASEQQLLLRARIRIEEQIQLCGYAQADPQGFRSLIQQRQQDRKQLSEGETGNGNGSPVHTFTPTPGGGGYGPGGGTGQQTGVGTPQATGGGYGPGPGTGEKTPLGTAQPTGGGKGPGPGTGEQTPVGTPQPTGGGTGQGPAYDEQTPAVTPQSTGGGTGPGPINGEPTPAGTPQPGEGGPGPGQQDPSVTPVKNGSAP